MSQMEKGQIQSVLGPVNGSELGVTYCHEHLLSSVPEPFRTQDPDLVMDNPSAAESEVSSFKESGGNTIVDVSPIGFGRDLAGLVQISRLTGVHIIGATGFHKDIYSCHLTASLSVEQMTETFVRELTIGVNEIRTGVIKVATSRDGITEGEHKVLLAAARAHLKTGAPITTHLEAGRLGIEQVDILTRAGVPPERITVGHLDRHLDPDYHVQILRRGVYGGFDQAGHLKYGTDADRAAAILELWRHGFGERIVLSSDQGRKSYWLANQGWPGLRYVLASYVPLLIQLGLDKAEAWSMVRENPRRALLG